MASFSFRVMSTLRPYVGSMASDTCVRATALSLGKTAEDLTLDDLPALDANIRRLLGPVAPQSVIDDIIADIGRIVE